MDKRKNILWLVSWYPNKYDLFDGDFIQRHARAAALHNDIHVLFVKQCFEQAGLEKTVTKENGLTEQIVYLPKQKSLAGKIRNHHEWRRYYKSELRLIFQKQPPDFVHVHVPWKAGLMALWSKKRLKLPYIVTEHWGIYNTVVEDNIQAKSFLVRALLKKIYSRASAFVSVSKFLGEAVNKTLVAKPFEVIPNVVDTALFFPFQKEKSAFTFLHVSNMVPLKNVEGILYAFKAFLEQGDADGKLLLVGNKNNYHVSLARDLGLLNTSVFFRGEIPYADVAANMQASCALVVNSNIENSPCVIGEALCCGLPVIATNVGGIPELLGAENGLLIPPQNVAALTAAMIDIHRNHSRYDGSAIAHAASNKFSVKTIATAFKVLYSQYGG